MTDDTSLDELVFVVGNVNDFEKGTTPEAEKKIDDIAGYAANRSENGRIYVPNRHPWQRQRLRDKSKDAVAYEQGVKMLGYFFRRGRQAELIHTPALADHDGRRHIKQGMFERNEDELIQEYGLDKPRHAFVRDELRRRKDNPSGLSEEAKQMQPFIDESVGLADANLFVTSQRLATEMAEKLEMEDCYEGVESRSGVMYWSNVKDVL